MSKEGDHHYVPQFHLRMWEGPNGKINQWGRVPFNDKLVCKPVTSAATAYLPGLYSLEHVNETEAQQIEKAVREAVDQCRRLIDELLDYWSLPMNGEPPF